MAAIDLQSVRVLQQAWKSGLEQQLDFKFENLDQMLNQILDQNSGLRNHLTCQSVRQWVTMIFARDAGASKTGVDNFLAST